MSASLPPLSARLFARSSALRASAMFVAATPARGEASTCGTTARAVSNSSIVSGVELHAAIKAETAAARIKLCVRFITCSRSLIVRRGFERRTLRIGRRRALRFLAQLLDAGQHLVRGLARSRALRLRHRELGIELGQLRVPLGQLLLVVLQRPTRLVEILLRALQLHGALLRGANCLLRLLHRRFATGNAFFRELGNAAATRKQPGCER